jgi:hypothetical protein
MRVNMIFNSGYEVHLELTGYREYRIYIILDSSSLEMSIQAARAMANSSRMMVE